MVKLTSFEGLTGQQLSECLEWITERHFVLREKMLLCKFAGKKFHAYKIEYIQLKRLDFLMGFEQGHRCTPLQACDNDSAEMLRVREFLSTPEREIFPI